LEKENPMRFLVTSLLSILISTCVTAQERTLNILSHAVHQRVAHGEGEAASGGDIAGEWAAKNNVQLNWITLNVDPIHERFLRELALSQTSIDLAFIVNSRFTPLLLEGLEPLGALAGGAPVEDVEGIAAGLLRPVTLDGDLIAIPYRHTTNALIYNEAILAERGFDGPPQSIDELIEMAHGLTFTRDDGTRVHGLTFLGTASATPLNFVGGFGATYIADDLTVKANSPEMIKALAALADLFQNGVLPPNITSSNLDDLIGMVASGQAAMAINPFARYETLNDPDVSSYAGQIKVAPFPATTPASSFANTEFWSMAIPKNSANKDLALSLIQELAKPENTVRAALNGNGSVRSTDYADPRVVDYVPYAAAEAAALDSLEVTIPAFDKTAQAATLFIEEMQAAMLGIKSPEQAAEDLQRRAEELVQPDR
jgi:multiple sugar transport system substrate-binding protein